MSTPDFTSRPFNTLRSSPPTLQSSPFSGNNSPITLLWFPAVLRVHHTVCWIQSSSPSLCGWSSLHLKRLTRPLNAKPTKLAIQIPDELQTRQAPKPILTHHMHLLNLSPLFLGLSSCIGTAWPLAERSQNMIKSNQCYIHSHFQEQDPVLYLS